MIGQIPKVCINLLIPHCDGDSADVSDCDRRESTLPCFAFFRLFDNPPTHQHEGDDGSCDGESENLAISVGPHESAFLYAESRNGLNDL